MSSRKANLLGFKLGRMTVIAEEGPNWICRCSCGKEKSLSPKNVLRVKSCGCLSRESSRNRGYNRAIPFWDKVKILGPDDCWEWQAGKLQRTGYGQYMNKQVSYRAHRYAYQDKIGLIPEGMLVCHRCDNPSCCNPNHLFLGTPLINNRDRKNKGRNRDQSGEKNNMAKLTEEKVKQIREMAKTMSTAKIARTMGLSESSTYFAIKGKTWKHVQ